MSRRRPPAPRKVYPCPICGLPRAGASPGRRCQACFLAARKARAEARRAREGLATCHPTRAATTGGLCRECLGLAIPDDPLPALVAGATQHAGPVAPRVCPKCRAAWDASGLYAICHICGATWHRTSERRLPAPGDTVEVARALAGLNGRRDPEGGRPARWGGIVPYRDEDSP